MQKYIGYAIAKFDDGTTGNVIAAAAAEVRVTGTGSLATLYATNSTGGATLSNPLTTDSNGKFEFYAENNRYNITLSKSGTTIVDSSLTDIVLYDVEDGGAQIKTAYEAETNAFTDAQFTKLAGIETGADVTDSTNVVAAIAGQAIAPGEVNSSGNVTIAGGSFSAPSSGEGLVYSNSTDGVVISGSGSSTDWVLANSSGSSVLYNPAGTQDVFFAGKIGVGVVPTASINATVRGSSTNTIFEAQNVGGFAMLRTGQANFVMSTTWNSANSALFVGSDGTTSRSINAAGTINASGADYAEYELKADIDATVNKGDVIGFDIDGKVTTSFSDSISFAVKSTDPSLVGGDAWAVTPRPENIEPQDDTEEEKTRVDTLNAENLAEWEIQHEVERATVDRIAYCGKVPVNGAPSCNVGDHLIAVAGTDDAITLVAKPRHESFEDSDNSIGRVKSFGEDGRPVIIVKMG